MSRDHVVKRAERGNAIAWTGFTAVQNLGMPCLAPNLINTVLMRLGASDFVLGLFAINQLLTLPAQVLAARATDRATNKVRLAWVSILGSVTPIALPISILLLTHGELDMWVFFAAAFAGYLVSQLFGVFGAVVQMDLMSRVFRPGRRGTILGFQGAFGGLAGAVGGLIVAGLMHRLAYPISYVCAWSTGFVLVVLGSLFLLRLRELPGLKARSTTDHPSVGQVFRTLAADRRFMVFLVAVVARMGFSAAQYYLWPTARRLRGLPDEYVGYLATLSSTAAMISSPLIGHLADRIGRAATGLGFAAVAICGFILFPHAASTPMLLVAYVLVIMGTAGITMPLFLSVLDLSPPRLRGSYVAARYAIESVSYAAFLPAFGYASTHLSAHVVFYTAALLCAVAGAVLFHVADGRDARRDA